MRNALAGRYCIEEISLEATPRPTIYELVSATFEVKVKKVGGDSCFSTHVPRVVITRDSIGALGGCLAGLLFLPRNVEKEAHRIMRAVLQRVLSARVEVEGRVVSSIGPGILVLVGLLDTDTEADAEYICRKILNTRLFPNEKTGKGWDLSVMQRNYEVLLVSQFTLYGQLKGNKLDFHVAMPPERAKPFYESLFQRVSNAYRADSVKGEQAERKFVCGYLASMDVYSQRFSDSLVAMSITSISDGIFGAMMQVHLVNDGPVTIQLDTQKANGKEANQSNTA